MSLGCRRHARPGHTAHPTTLTPRRNSGSPPGTTWRRAERFPPGFCRLLRLPSCDPRLETRLLLPVGPAEPPAPSPSRVSPGVASPLPVCLLLPPSSSLRTWLRSQRKQLPWITGPACRDSRSAEKLLGLPCRLSPAPQGPRPAIYPPVGSPFILRVGRPSRPHLALSASCCPAPLV